MSNKAFFIILFSFLFLLAVTVVIWVVQVNKRGTIACKQEGAEYRWGLTYNFCLQPDGTVWRIP